MSERRIGDHCPTVEEAQEQKWACVDACTGAPAAIQPGCVVAMAEALKDCIDFMENDIWPAADCGPEFRKARAALALYSGAGCAE